MTETALQPAGQVQPANPADRWLALLNAVQGSTCPERVIEILRIATLERKITWIRDAAYMAVTFIPFLAVSFRLAFPQNTNLLAEGPPPGPPRALNVVFMDGKDILLTPGAGYSLSPLGDAVRASFRDAYQRDHNERMEWLEAALRMFLPMVVTSDPREPAPEATPTDSRQGDWWDQ